MSDAAEAHLSEEQRRLLRRSEQLARDELCAAAQSGAAHHVNRALVRSLAEHGLLHEVLGGERIAAVNLCLIREGLARHCTEAETALAVQGLGALPILTSARNDVRDTWMPRIVRGEAVAGFALTEPEAGSDAAALQLAAVRDGDGYRLTGEKAFISNSPEADIYTVFARTGGGRRDGITAFAVPGDSPGLSGEATELLSEHPIGTLRFQDVRVPATNIIGETGAGFAVAMQTLDVFRPSVGAAAVGIARAAIDSAVAYVSQRTAFGGPLSRLQGVTHQLADAATTVQAARLLVHAAATVHDAGVRPAGQLSAMAKLFATETASKAVDVAIQVHGARALQRGHLLEHLYREVRALRIYEGASEVQREIIARQLFRQPGRGSTPASSE